MATTGSLTTTSIKVTVLNKQAIQSLNAIIKVLTNMGVAANVSMQKASASGRKADTVFKKLSNTFNKVGADIKKLIPSLSSLNALLTALSVAGAIAALSKLSESFLSLASLAGEIQQTGIAFERFVEAARLVNKEFAAMVPNASAFMHQLQNASMGMLSAAKIAKTSVRAFTLFGDTIGTRLPEVFQIASAAALLQGKTVEHMVNSIVTGSARLFNSYFQQLGLVIDLKQAYADYADALDITGDLTRVQKSQAALNAALDQGRTLVAAIGDANLLLAVNVSRVKAQFTDLRDSILNDLAPAFTAILELVGDFTARAVPQIQSFVHDAVQAFAGLTPAIKQGVAPMSAEVVDAITEAQNSMGTRVGNWIVDAASWGANIGSQFGIGILDGFTAVVVAVMNGIASLLSFFLKPSSPPLVAPDIDKWGEELAKLYLEGFNSYPPEFKDFLFNLQAQLQALPQQELFQAGIDAIAPWAEGLSTFDLSFMQEKVRKELREATDVRDQLKEQLEGERKELFKLQVLNRDPAAIRAKLKQVKATRSAKEQQEAEVRALEKRRDEIQEQLRLFRLIERVLRSIRQAQEQPPKPPKPPKPPGGGGELPTGEGLLDNLLEGFEKLKASGAGLQATISGIKERLEEVFGEPFANLQAAFTENVGKMETAWKNLKSVLEATGILEKLSDPQWARAIGTFVGISISLTLLLGVVKLLVTPVGILATIFTAFSLIMAAIARKQAPNLSEKLGILEQTLLAIGFASETARKILGLLAIWLVRLWGIIPITVGEALITVANGLVVLADVVGFAGPDVLGFSRDLDVLREAGQKLIDSQESNVKRTGDWAAEFAGSFSDTIAIADRAIGSYKDTEKGIWSLAIGMNQAVPDIVRGVGDFGHVFDETLPAYEEHMAGLGITASQSLSDVSLAFLNAGDANVNNLISGMVAQQPQLESTMSALNRTMVSSMSFATLDYLNAGGEIMQGLQDGITSEQGALTSQIDGIAAEMVTTLEAALGIRSPSTIFKEIGESVIDGLIAGLSKEFDIAAALGTIEELFFTTWESVNLTTTDGMIRLYTLLSSSFEGFISVINYALEDIKLKIFNALIVITQNIRTKLSEWNRIIHDGFSLINETTLFWWEAIKLTIDTKLVEIWDMLTVWVADVNDKMYEAGKQFVKHLKSGFDTEFPSLEEYFRERSERLAAAMIRGIKDYWLRNRYSLASWLAAQLRWAIDQA
ncbi:MAG: hypothetical protein ACXAB4_03720, partial [Candidatus Hodarchaeales archaeon]